MDQAWLTKRKTLLLILKGGELFNELWSTQDKMKSYSRNPSKAARITYPLQDVPAVSYSTTYESEFCENSCSLRLSISKLEKES